MSPFYKYIFDGWSKPNWITWLLLPLTLVYRLLNGLRSFLYRLGVAKSHKVDVPVVIVGNISVGGTGKTPLTIALVNLLIEQGFRPGVISRGYGGKAIDWPQVVKSDSNPHYMGDEAVLIARETSCPVIVGPERVKAANQMVSEFDVNIIISDDGLQHKALARDIEIAVVDTQRQHRNLLCLPSGPLREPVKRLKTVDLVMLHVDQDGLNKELLSRFGLHNNIDELSTMTLQPKELKPLLQEVNDVPEPPAKIHAVAGIGHPKRFFKLLKKMGFEVIEHAFADHHEFSSKDFQSMLDSEPKLPIVMTEKDAVKCVAFASDQFFFVPVCATLNKKAESTFLELLDSVKSEATKL